MSKILFRFMFFTYAVISVQSTLNFFCLASSPTGTMHVEDESAQNTGSSFQDTILDSNIFKVSTL